MPNETDQQFTERIQTAIRQRHGKAAETFDGMHDVMMGRMGAKRDPGTGNWVDKSLRNHPQYAHLWRT